MLSRVEYGGWANNIKLSNGAIELIATADVGPRILRFGFVGGDNLLKEFPEQLGGQFEDEWMIRGGHRLWHAPEVKPRTYALDNSPVEVEELGDFGVRLLPGAESENGIQKEMDIIMSADDNLVTVVHRLTNIGPWDIELSAWALTVMAPGGVCIVPLPEKRPHTEVVLPEFPLITWPYTDLADSRCGWGSRYITFRQDAQKGPGKFGMAVSLGWAAYQLRGTLFVKYFDYDPCMTYPDLGCNFETFSNEEMLEVETLGPQVLLGSGDTIEHTETWRLFADVPAITDEDSIDRFVAPLVQS